MKTGGPAFPTSFKFGGITKEGMTLRQYYAGEAMKSFSQETIIHNYDHVARSCFAQADAMIKEGEKDDKVK